MDVITERAWTLTSVAQRLLIPFPPLHLQQTVALLGVFESLLAQEALAQADMDVEQRHEKRPNKAK